MFLKADFWLKAKKILSQNWRGKIFWKKSLLVSKTRIKFHVNPGLAKLGFEQLGPEVMDWLMVTHSKQKQATSGVIIARSGEAVLEIIGFFELRGHSST